MMDDNQKRITSLRNPRIKSLRQLRKKRDRDNAGLIVIEGIRELLIAMNVGIIIEEIYFDDSEAMSEDESKLGIFLKQKDFKIYGVTPAVMQKISYRAGSSGVVAVVQKPERSLKEMQTENDPLYIVMDDIEKPGNLGAVLRSADGSGVTGVIASDERVDLYNPNVIRASLGTIFSVPTVATTLEEAIMWLRSKAVQIVVTAPGADTLYTDVDLRGPTAVVVGSEDRGARQEWLDAADVKVKIPMRGSADSLNVAQSATILMYEALRQRSIVGK